MIPVLVSVSDVEISVEEEDDDPKADSKSAINTQEPPLMQTRLLKTGIVKSAPDFEFVVDRVSKEVLGLEASSEEKKDESEQNEENVTHVKTGVWQVLCFDNEGNPLCPFYVVTGVSMDDRVDTKKLRKAIFSGQSYGRRPKLSMAPTEIAEELTGYKSGTMAPICHSVDSKLFLEESIASVDDWDHKLNVGSGMFGKCLSISADKFLQIAKANPKGVEICSLIAKKKPSKRNP
jgi:prolyl-tRNA editing enzyme YbaK/EbsC (Cys-tRNA(Pro) deacylase)